ncbi:polysaccharide export outer membrane protein [Rhodovulum iodosum]|uniref:Polysaccharide export outer membrane protein n=1 Tax=Rhodovulum iodosum TaxID=68291 RepID=A0ABV3XRT5_9RHOB|nr:polysaccharide biosynthesis/export family protein [Rhodovulum robiginosum]RSK30389.1 polysaccharide export protein [Rhodovulum robiginosum]
MPDHHRRQVLVLGAASLLSACSLPRGAAQENEILGSTKDDALAGYAIYQVSRAFLPQVAEWPTTGKRPMGGWIARQRGPSGQVIAAGDQVNLVVWDSDENSLLTSPEQKVVQMNGMTVSPNGALFVPYVDEVYVAGMTPSAARAKIQAQLEAIIPSAQVQLSLASGPRSSVSVVGGVGRPGTYPIVDRDMTVLSLISQGGGVLPSLRNPLIRLVRGGDLYVTSISRLYDNPGLDTTLRAGDKVIVEEDPRYFLALGAGGSETLIPFPKDDVSALDAMALIGGVADNRADPRGILILREYPASAIRAGMRGPREQRVIFTIDLTTADGLFSAGKFAVNPGDLVYISESPITSVDTISRIVGNFLALGSRASNL